MQTISKLLCYIIAVLKRAAIILIKRGLIYEEQKNFGNTEDVVSSYSVDVTKDNGKTVHIGDYSTVEELDKAISDAVKNGQLTQEEADSVQQ
jgi:hypothetical protein